MSWMDSWSRPQKDQAVPAPFYLTHADTAKYCHTCGRIIGSRRSNTAKSSHATVKYCSDRCKRTKPSNAADSLEKQIEAAILKLLQGQAVEGPRLATQSADDDDNGNKTTDHTLVKAKHTPKKGDPRIIVLLSEVEEAVFGSRYDPEKTFGRKRNRRRRGVADDPEWKSVDMLNNSGQPHGESGDAEDHDNNSYSDSDDSSPEMFETQGVKIRIRPAQSRSEVNFSVGGERGWAEKIEETPEMEQKRLEGVRRAEEKELVKQAARRAVVFGVAVDRNPSANMQQQISNIHGRGTNKRDKKQKRKKEADNVELDETEELNTRKCEALMNNTVVEPSFAKGDWAIRWRDD